MHPFSQVIFHEQLEFEFYLVDNLLAIVILRQLLLDIGNDLPYHKVFVDEKQKEALEKWNRFHEALLGVALKHLVGGVFKELRLVHEVLVDFLELAD